jgi:hypothetical protein
MLRSWLSNSHSGAREIGGAALLYAVYEVVRGFGGENYAAAYAHTDDIVALERRVGVYWEHGIQRVAEAIPAVPTLLGLLYVALHFAGTAGFLVWVHRRHRHAFPVVRTALIVSTALALVGYVLYPAAPPRLADLGFADTVSSSTGLNLSSDLLGALYNPIAAVPSLHFGYALLVGMGLHGLGHRKIGAAYPVLMLIVIVATGNHFFLDAAAGGAVTVAGWWIANRVIAPAPRARAIAVPA